MDLDEQKVSKAVEALIQVAQKLEQKSLVDNVMKIQMQICLKKIPPKEKCLKLKLPHCLKHENMEVCLFVKDLDRDDRDYEPTVRHFQEKFKKHGIKCVTEIIPLKSLKTEYKPYEAKRNLSNAYDVFLADARIIRLLPSHLGKFFYGMKKAPIQVNLQAKKLEEEINSALDTSLCVFTNRGASSAAVVANLEMGKTEITANILSSVQQISQTVPGGLDNIKQLNIKTPLSTSIPIYLSSGGPQEVTIAKDHTEHESIEAEEVTTVIGATVKVYPSGDIKLVKDGESQEEAPQKRRRLNKRTRAKASKTKVTTPKNKIKRKKQ